MKISNRPRGGAVPIFLGCLLSCSVRAASADGAKESKPVVMAPFVVDETKPDTLFKGTDISVVLDKGAYPVRDVDGSQWVVAINGVDRTISAKRAPVNLKMTTSLKLTEVTARIANFSQVPGYSFGNDPVVIQSRALMRAATTNYMLQGIAQDARDYSDTTSNAALGGAALMAKGDQQFGDAALFHTAQTITTIEHPGVGTTSTKLNRALMAEQAADANLSSATEPLGTMTTHGFDAMVVDFSIESARMLRTPYVVTIARFHDPQNPPGTVQKLVFARALDPIDRHPSRIHFEEDGYPFNYELLDFEVHLYNRGIEIATDLSPGRMDMSRDEAFNYIRTEYIAAHKGQTLAPAPAMGKLPAELPARLAAGAYADTIYVKVSADGLATEAFADEACSKRIDDALLEKAVRGIRFKPALANGEPSAGVAPLNLGKLQI